METGQVLELVVLEIYRITLLSNGTAGLIGYMFVLEIYRITLLSNAIVVLYM